VTRMLETEAMRFLADGTRTGKLATASAAGAPHVAPIWFVVDGHHLVFTTHIGTVKSRNLRENARAALTVDVSEFPYDFVIVRGEVAVVQRAPDLLEWSTRIAERYVPDGQAEEYGKRNAVPEELLCRLRIERVVGEKDIAL
jgi:PPOX class probable F420-dependent enzyme